MAKKPTVKPYLDDEERDLIQQLESDGATFKSVMTPARREKLMEAPRATLNRES
jgi:hypothetical protein